ncbi:MAG: hypothetical protein ACI4NC_06305 [Succinivibrio sp.]
MVKQLQVNGGVQLVEADTTTIQLTKPIQWGAKEITEIELKPMSFQYARKYGIPVKNGNAEDPDFEKIALYIQDLGALPPTVVNALSFQDVMNCLNHIISFFRIDGN